MTDLLYIGVAVLFFAVTYGLLRLCERLAERGPEEHS
jgi:hypothetical protein